MRPGQCTPKAVQHTQRCHRQRATHPVCAVAPILIVLRQRLQHRVQRPGRQRLGVQDGQDEVILQVARFQHIVRAFTLNSACCLPAPARSNCARCGRLASCFVLHWQCPSLLHGLHQLRQLGIAGNLGGVLHLKLWRTRSSQETRPRRLACCTRQHTHRRHGCGLDSVAGVIHPLVVIKHWLHNNRDEGRSCAARRANDAAVLKVVVAVVGEAQLEEAGERVTRAVGSVSRRLQ